MLVEKVENYLTSKDKTLDEVILENMKDAVAWSTKRQFMEVREHSPGLRGSNPGPCARKMAYGYLGYRPGKDFEARTYVTFWTGDIIEVASIVLMRLAGIELEATCLDAEGQVEGLFDAGNGMLIPCHPDGIILPQVGITDEKMLLEVKSTSDFGFKREWLRGNYSDQYKLQHQVYLETFGMDRGLFFVINKNTGHMCEVATERDPDYLEWARVNYGLAASADPDNMPPRFVDDKNFGRKLTRGGKPTENLAWGCGYCDFVGHCWPALKVDISKGKPVHNVPLDVIDATPEVRFPEIIGTTGANVEINLFEDLDL